MNEVFAFECSVTGTDWKTLINARTPGKAKYQHWLSVKECYPDIPITAMRARKLGKAENTEGFKRTAVYRGLPNVGCGDRVRVGNATGVIVGSNGSANFDILFDDDSPTYAGMRLNVHPHDLQMI